MKHNRLRMAVFAAICLTASTAHAQKQKKITLPPGNLFFSLKGQPYALEQAAPGIQGALMLTDEQKLKLTEALETTIWSERVRTAAKTLKADPDVTDARMGEARKVVQEARARLKELVDGALSPEQKTLIQRINAAAAEAHIAARKKLELEFNAAKADKFQLEELNRQMRLDVQAELNRALPGILTVDQLEAMQKAAQQQKDAEEAAAKKGKSPPL